ncbi:MAG: GNAT family N-acetyltransferase [Bulleidia sp.]|nr:GNAT family N-acetyltransferase [Bulleidia sp.]
MTRNSITLRPMTLDDTDLIVAWRNKPSVLKYFLDQRLITPESHMAYYRSRIETGQVKQWIIIDNDKEIGTVFLRDIDYQTKSAEYGVFIGEDEYRSHGIGSYLAAYTAKYAFDEMGLETVFARVLENNPRSWKSFLKAGYHMDERTDTVIINGKQERVVFLSVHKGELS